MFFFFEKIFYKNVKKEEIATEAIFNQFNFGVHETGSKDRSFKVIDQQASSFNRKSYESPSSL